jgi:hypothetical protein
MVAAKPARHVPPPPRLMLRRIPLEQNFVWQNSSIGRLPAFKVNLCDISRIVFGGGTKNDISLDILHGPYSGGR